MDRRINKNLIPAFLVFLCVLGCQPLVSWSSEITYLYINQSGLDLVIEAYDTPGNGNRLIDRWKINHNEMISIGPLSGEPSSNPFFGFKNGSSDFVIIRFDHGECLTYHRFAHHDDSHQKNIFDLRSYPDYVKRLRKNRKKTNQSITIRNLCSLGLSPPKMSHKPSIVIGCEIRLCYSLLKKTIYENGISYHGNIISLW